MNKNIKFLLFLLLGIIIGILIVKTNPSKEKHLQKICVAIEESKAPNTFINSITKGVFGTMPQSIQMSTISAFVTYKNLYICSLMQQDSDSKTITCGFCGMVFILNEPTMLKS